jgi:hypothetical protein
MSTLFEDIDADVARNFLSTTFTQKYGSRTGAPVTISWSER